MKILLLLIAFALPAAAQDRKVEADRALRGIEAFTSMQARTDPHYRAVEDLLLLEVDDIIKAMPAADWLAAIRRRYVALSDAEHAKERDAIRQSEVDAARHLQYGDAGWKARTAQLDDLTKSGELGPRIYAIRTAEAAKLYFPDGHDFLAWRQAKIPIATDYEMGNITRSDYEERWNKTTAYFMDRQATNDREQARMRAMAATEELRIRAQALQQVAPRPMVRCTTTSAYGVSTTRCF